MVTIIFPNQLQTMLFCDSFGLVGPMLLEAANPANDLNLPFLIPRHGNSDDVVPVVAVDDMGMRGLGRVSFVGVDEERKVPRQTLKQVIRNATEPRATQAERPRRRPMPQGTTEL